MKSVLLTSTSRRCRVAYAALLAASLLLAAAECAAYDPYGLTVSAGGGFAWSSPGNINSAYIDRIAAPAGFLQDHLDHRATWLGEGEYPLLPGLTLALGITYSQATSERSSRWIQAGENGQAAHAVETEVRLRARAWVPHLRLKYTFSHGQPRLFIGGAILYGLGKVVLESRVTSAQGADQTASRNEYSARKLGVMVGLGASYRLMSRVGLTAEAGYRWLDLGELKDSSDEVWYVGSSQDRQALTLDFNGPYLIAYLSVEL